jgi:hypothetical protein
MSLNAIVSVIHDGKEHSLLEIQKKTKIAPRKLEMIVVFLRRYGFIKRGLRKQYIKIDPLFEKFLHRIEDVDPSGVK